MMQIGGGQVLSGGAGFGSEETARETREIEDALKVVGELLERCGGINSMLDELGSRLLGLPMKADEKLAQAASPVAIPVRAEIPELKHRIGQLRTMLISAESRIVQLGRL